MPDAVPTNERLADWVGLHNLTFSRDPQTAGQARDDLWDALSQNLDGVMAGFRALIELRELRDRAQRRGWPIVQSELAAILGPSGKEKDHA